ncbi:cupin domain-containing protein [Nocardia arthritidis]|uniref:Cupin domain-containing protein n=1 Tax=Nocardia arthritidis TaxID=228602 RepID=A0A6G9YS48_9NOCA|nr:cupin domain-containing protein [Nocardia arthritidis]QIS16024.1 cupin domain-containing protein [Nocardia arthritidis]
MHVIQAEETPKFEVPGIEFTGMAAPSRGSKELCTWRITVAPHRASDDPHVLDRDEIFMLTSGRLEISGRVVRAGDTVVIPAGEPITVANPNDEPAEAFVAIAAGFAAKMADGPAVRPPWAQ